MVLATKRNLALTSRPNRQRDNKYSLKRELECLHGKVVNGKIWLLTCSSKCP